MFRFLLYESMDEAGLQVLREAGEVRLANDTDEDTIISEIADVEGVIIRSRGAMTARIMENAPRLQVVGRHGVGVDNIDLEAATAHGIQVVNTPQATVESVAEHAVGLMLAISKGIVPADGACRAGDFEYRYSVRGQEMRGRTLGVVGLGRIGQRVAQICHLGFGMPILYYDVRRALQIEEDLEAQQVNLEELLSTADYVSVHVPLLDSTRGLIGQHEFSLMKPETVFCNTSRGPVVDEEALYHALKEGRLRAAGIDVFEQEPTPADNPLFELDNVVVTPHIASSTAEAMRNMSLVAEDVVATLEGRSPKYPVNTLS